MGKLPIVSGDQARKALEKAGWQFERQSGSHMILVKDGCPANLAIPRHREPHRGTLRAILSDTGLTVDEFVALL